MIHATNQPGLCYRPAAADDVARAFAGALDEPGWYVNFQSAAQAFVVFPGKIFRYPRGDQAGRRLRRTGGG